MAQVFSTTNAIVPAPVMTGGYFPGIDIRQVDGRGVVQPWGGGPLSRQFQTPVPIGQEPTSETNTQNLLNLMIQTLPIGNPISYNFEGLVGPPGIPGPVGPTSFVFARDIGGNVLNAPTRVLDDGAIPGTVANVNATAMILAVMLEWDANTELDIDHYVVYRYTSDASGSSSAILTTYATLCIDGNRTGGTEYFYWVKAVDYLGNASAAYSTSASATPTDVEVPDIIEIAADKVLISGTTYLSNWRHSSDVTKIDGGDIYASSITLAKAADDLKGLAGDQVASGGSSLLPNWRLDISDSSGRPTGIYPVRDIVDFSQLDWLDAGKAEIKILSTPDTQVGYGFPAIPIDDKQKYTITIRHKSSAASIDGHYLAMREYDAALPSTKTHIGVDGGANTQEQTSHSPLITDGAMPGTSWTVDEYTYTPTAGTKYASFAMLNWNPDTAEVEYHVDYVLMYLVPKDADQIAESATNKWAAESGADVTGNNTADDTSNVDGLTATSVSGWAHGSNTTKIDGGTIYTDSIVTDSLAANLITYTELRQVGGSEAVDTAAMRTDAVTNPKITNESVAISAYNTNSTSVSLTSVGGGISGTTTVLWEHSGGLLNQLSYHLEIGGVEFGYGWFSTNIDDETHSATISGLAVPGSGGQTIEMVWSGTNWGTLAKMAYGFEHRGK